MECSGPGDVGVEVEQAACLGGGERDEIAPVLVRYEGWRGISSWRGENFSPGVKAPFLQARRRRSPWPTAGCGASARRPRRPAAGDAWAGLDGGAAGAQDWSFGPRVA